MAIKITVPPAVEPVTLAQLKNHLRIIHDEEDSILMLYLKAARQYAETTLCWRAFVEQEQELVLDSFQPVITLPRPPLQEVLSVKYRTADGAEYTIDPSDYIVDADSEPGRIVPVKAWTAAGLYQLNAVRIRYKAGYPVVVEEIEDEAVGTGDKETTVFQLKKYPVKPGSETVYVSSVPITNYSLDYETGEMIFNTAPDKGAVITAGYTREDFRANVPDEIKQGVLILAGHFYEVREPVVIGTSVLVVPFTVEALLMPYRAWGADTR